MKTIAAILVLLATCRPGPAQGQNSIQLTPNVRLYEPKNLTPDRAQRVASFVQSLVPGTGVYWSDVPHAIVISSRTPADTDAAEAMVKRFDVPEPKPAALPQVDCTVYLIRASSSATPPQVQATRPAPAPGSPVPVELQSALDEVKRTGAPAPASPVPAELQPALDEMKRSFGYDRYTLWDAIMIQPNGGAQERQGILPAEHASRPYVYSLTYDRSFVTAASNLSLYGFIFSVKMPYGNDGIESHIKTDVVIHEGQKLVLGKIRLLPAENADLFLVLATKVH